MGISNENKQERCQHGTLGNNTRHGPATVLTWGLHEWCLETGVWICFSACACVLVYIYSCVLMWMCVCVYVCLSVCLWWSP